jgi:hypothetical protein
LWPWRGPADIIEPGPTLLHPLHRMPGERDAVEAGQPLDLGEGLRVVHDLW